MTDTNQEVRETPEALTFTYTNWRGETAERRIRVKGASFRYAATEWHPEPQWLLSAIDLDKMEGRDFAWKDIVPDTVVLHEATNLATALFNKHFRSDEDYASGRVVWQPLSDLRGVISQIDNMTTALVRASAPPPAVPDAVGVRVSNADLAQMALCQVQWIEEGKTEHPHRLNTIRTALDRLAALSFTEPTLSPEPQASNAGAVDWNSAGDLARVRREAGRLWDEDQPGCGWSRENRDCYIIRAALELSALTTPEPQTGERDGEDSPYTWIKTQRVPGTSHVGGSLMLLAEDGRCVGTVKVMMGEGATEIDVHRALQTAGNPAKLQRFIRAARNGEQEANERAEAAERRLAEVGERTREDERDRLYEQSRLQSYSSPWEFFRRNGAMLPADRAALRAKPEAQAIVGKEGEK